MGVSTIDGSITSATLKRSFRGISLFKEIVFQQTDGASRTMKNMVTTDAVAEGLKPGNTGRFYLYTSLDVKGVHGWRLANGTQAYGVPGNNERVFLILGVVAVLWVIVKIVTAGGVPLLGVGMIVLAIVGYVMMSKTKREAKTQFEADAGHAPPA